MSQIMGFRSLKLSAAFLVLAPVFVSAQNPITPGVAMVEYPTVTSVGIIWPFSGDANRNSQVAVEYRKVGETTWKNATSLPSVT